MKLILDKTIRIHNYIHDFENGWVYVLKMENSRAVDHFFADRSKVYPDGTLKKGGQKWFFSPPGFDVCKGIDPIQPDRFNDFDHLYMINEFGEIVNVDGEVVS